MAKTKTTNMDNLVQQTQPEVVKATNDKQTLINLMTKKFGTIQNFSHINPVNTYENRWRVNVYTKTQGFITKFTITKSFFIIMENGKISNQPNFNG